jgi:hypothetical protein
MKAHNALQDNKLYRGLEDIWMNNEESQNETQMTLQLKDSKTL